MALVDEIGIGVGLFLIIFIWAVSIFLCLALSRAKGRAGFVGTLLTSFINHNFTKKEIENTFLFGQIYDNVKRVAAVVILILASLITLILWYIPRLPPEGVIEEVKVYDYFFIARASLLTILGFFVIVGAFFILVHYVSEPIRAKAIKTKRY